MLRKAQSGCQQQTKSSPATDTPAKQSPVEASADGSSAADKQSPAKQSPVRVVSSRQKACLQKTHLQSRAQLNPPVVEPSEAEQRSAATGTSAKDHSAAGTAAKADSAAGEGSLRNRSSCKAQQQRDSHQQQSQAKKLLASPHSPWCQSTQQVKTRPAVLCWSDAAGTDAVAADESLPAIGAPIQTASSNVQGRKGRISLQDASSVSRRSAKQGSSAKR